MHFVITAFYGGTVWLAMLAYMLIIEGPFWVVAACGPFVISGAMIAIWALEYAIHSLQARFTKSENSDARP